MAFEVSRIPFPDLGLRDGGYGSSIVPIGRLPRVVLSPPSGGVKVPLACADLETGKVTTARGLLGEVRDGSIDEEAYELRVTTVCRRETACGEWCIGTPIRSQTVSRRTPSWAA